MSPNESLYEGSGAETPKAKPLGVMDQFIGLFTEPSETFRKLHDAPAWAWVLLVVVGFSLVVAAVWGFKVDVEGLVRPGMEANPRMTAEQIDQAITFLQKFFPYFVILQTMFIIPIALLVVAFLYWLVGKGTAEGEPPTFLRSFTAAVVPGLAVLPQSFLILVMCFLRPVGALTPDKLSPSSLGFYVHPENVKLHALLGQLDPFILYNFVLVYLAGRHLLKLKPIGAAACTALSVALVLVFRVLLAK